MLRNLCIIYLILTRVLPVQYFCPWKLTFKTQLPGWVSLILLFGYFVPYSLVTMIWFLFSHHPSKTIPINVSR